MTSKKVKAVFYLLYLVFGVYFINYGFNFIEIPEVVSNFDNWIIVAGGVLILVGGINYFRATKNVLG